MIYGPIICCKAASKVNEIAKQVSYKYVKVEIGMAINMNDIPVAWDVDYVRKETRSNAKNKQIHLHQNDHRPTRHLRIIIDHQLSKWKSTKCGNTVILYYFHSYLIWKEFQ